MNFLSNRLVGNRPLQFTDLRNVQTSDGAYSSDNGEAARKGGYERPAIKKTVSSAKFGHANLTRKPTEDEVAIRKSSLALDLARLQENKENISQLSGQGGGAPGVMMSFRTSQQDDRFHTSRSTTTRSEAPTTARLGTAVPEAPYSLPISRQASKDDLILESLSSPESSAALSSARSSSHASLGSHGETSQHRGRSWEAAPEGDSVQVDEEGDEDMVDYVFSKARHNRMDDLVAALEKGFDVNARDKFGNALIHICAQNNNAKLVSLLLKKFPHLNINARNLKLMTALDYAEKYNFSRLVELLQAKGAKSGTSGESTMRASRFR